MEIQNNSNRIYLYDNIKFLAILLVVIGHSIDFLTGGSGNTLEKSLFLTIYSIHMPLFIFISGLFLKAMDRTTKFPKQKVIAFVLIGIAYRIVMSLLNLILGYDDHYAILDMYDTAAWFMWAMAVFISIVWLFREYNTKIILAASVIIGCMAGYDDFIGDKFALMRIFVLLPFFIAGYIIKPEQLAKLLSKRWLKIVSVFVVVGFIIFFFTFTKGYSYLRPMFTARNDFSTLGRFEKYGLFVRLLCYGISCVFGFAVMCLVPNKNLGIITKSGSKTLQIYFWHQVFLGLLYTFGVYGFIASFTGETIATVIYILIAVCVAFICSLPILSFPTKQILSFGKNKKK